MQPYVSCVCPTYNRRKFLPNLVRIFNSQSYPADRRQLIIMDDSFETNQDIVDENKTEENKKYNNIKYIYSQEKIPLGKKRNMLNDIAKKKGEFIVCFDDDDYYPPERISHAIQVLNRTKAPIVGCTTLLIYYADIKKIYELGPFGKHHGTAGTFAYRRSYLDDHRYEENADKAEEKYFLSDYKVELAQLEPKKVMICMYHGANTCDKRNVIQNSNIKLVGFKLKDIVKDKVLFKFYDQLTEEIAIDPEMYAKYFARKIKFPEFQYMKNTELTFSEFLDKMHEKNQGFPKSAIEYYFRKNTDIIQGVYRNNELNKVDTKSFIFVDKDKDASGRQMPQQLPPQLTQSNNLLKKPMSMDELMKILSKKDNIQNIQEVLKKHT